MGEDEPSDADRDELLFTVERLHGTIVQNYAQSLQILGATLAVVTALMGFAFSRDVTATREKAGLFASAGFLAIVALMQSVDRARSTHMMAAYLRVFVEPLLNHFKWESRLLEFRRLKYAAGTGGFTFWQWGVYALVIVINSGFATFYWWSGWQDGNLCLRIVVQFILTAFALGALAYTGYLIVKFEVHQAKNLDAHWQKIKEAEPSAQVNEGATDTTRSVD